MTNEQTTVMLKDDYFRTPVKELNEPVAEVETTSVNGDDVKYKDKYFQTLCEAVES